MSEETLSKLSRGLLYRVKQHFADEANRADFERWYAERYGKRYEHEKVLRNAGRSAVLPGTRHAGCG